MQPLFCKSEYCGCGCRGLAARSSGFAMMCKAAQIHMEGSSVVGILALQATFRDVCLTANAAWVFGAKLRLEKSYVKRVLVAQ